MPSVESLVEVIVGQNVFERLVAPESVVCDRWCYHTEEEVWCFINSIPEAGTILRSCRIGVKGADSETFGLVARRSKRVDDADSSEIHALLQVLG